MLIRFSLIVLLWDFHSWLFLRSLLGLSVQFTYPFITDSTDSLLLNEANVELWKNWKKILGFSSTSLLYLFKEEVTQFGNWTNNVFLAFHTNYRKDSIGSSAAFSFSLICTREAMSDIKFKSLCSVLLGLCTQLPDGLKLIRYSTVAFLFTKTTS